MNALGSDQCNSGCESGWTIYLDHHSSSNFNDEYCCYHDENKDTRTKNENSQSDSGEEDLSMLSDASSGPPHFPDHQSCYFNAQEDFSVPMIKASKVVLLNRRSKKRQRVEENQQHHDDDDDDDDDTASSPLCDFSMNNISVSDASQQTSTESAVDYSQGFSATYFEERSSLQGFLEQSLSENEGHNNK